jgi:hypothetical protein
MIEIGPNLKDLIMHISAGAGVLIFLYIMLR